MTASPKLNIPEMHVLDKYSGRLGYRTLVITSVASLLGAALGMIGVVKGAVVGLERPLVLSCLIYSGANLLLLRFSRRIEVEKIARVSTIYFAVYLSAGTVISLFSGAEHFMSSCT